MPFSSQAENIRSDEAYKPSFLLCKQFLFLCRTVTLSNLSAKTFTSQNSCSSSSTSMAANLAAAAMATNQYFVFDSWTAVLVSFLIWGSAYFTCRILLPSKSPEYCSRLITLIHGVIVAFFGLNQCFVGKPPFDHPEEPTTQIQALILVTSLGYFMVDLSWCLYFQTETTLMVAHHIYSVIALSRMLFNGTSGHQAACGLGALEITNPLLQARWFIRTAGKHNTPLFMSVEITFMIMYIAIRIVLGFIYLIIVIIHPKNTMEFRLLAIIIYMVSWGFMLNIAKYFTKKYMKNKKDAELPHINTS